MKVVSNAGPLIALGKLGRLVLLKQLYGAVLISPEVYQEVVVNGLRRGEPDASDVQFLIHSGDIRIVPVDMSSGDPLLAMGIDLGEAETLALARTERADLVLVDNAHARRAARSLGLPLKGTVGILLQALRSGILLLTDFELLMHQIKHQPTLWISERLCDEALNLVRRKD